MSLLENESVMKVRRALSEAGYEGTVVELAKTARSAEDAANSIGAELGSIVKTLIFVIGNHFVMALVAGDNRCKEENLPGALNIEGTVRRPNAEEVRGAIGFSIGGVPPVGLDHPIPTVMDVSLKRFETLYAAAGHPHCVFPTTVSGLKRLTGCIVSCNIAEPID